MAFVNEPKYFGVMKTLQQDMPRIVGILQAIDSFSKKWNRKNFLTTLGKRIQHGVPAAYINLIGIKGVGKVKAEKLFEQGFKNKSDILKNIDAASKIAGIKPESFIQNIKESQD